MSVVSFCHNLSQCFDFWSHDLIFIVFVLENRFLYGFKLASIGFCNTFDIKYLSQWENLFWCQFSLEIFIFILFQEKETTYYAMHKRGDFKKYSPHFENVTTNLFGNEEYLRLFLLCFLMPNHDKLLPVFFKVLIYPMQSYLEIKKKENVQLRFLCIHFLTISLDQYSKSSF